MNISLAQNKNKETVIKIVFEYNFDLVMKVRAIPGRKYYTDPPCWSVPYSTENVQQLIEYGFKANEYLLSFVNEQKQKKIGIALKGIEGLKGNLMPFQNEGIAFIEDKNDRALLADEMGLGKTIQSIAWLQLHKDKIPVVVVCPASLKLNWQKEIEKWLDKPKTQVLSGSKIYKTTGNILIINYDIVFAWISEFKRRSPKVLILDESHYIKANSARRTKTIKALAKRIPHVIALSGTPILNRPVEIYNAVNIIDPNLFPNFMAFTRRYCKAHHNGFGWDFNGASNTLELNSILSKYVMIRRLKQDVLKELPDKIYSFVPMELDNEKEYRKAEIDFIEYVRQIKGRDAAERIKSIEALAKIEGLKQLAVKGKMNQVMEWITNFLDSENKLVVFAVHKFVIELLMESFKDVVVKIDGNVSANERQKAVDEFQNNDKIKLFVGNIQAAGVGITLTASSNVVFIELPWQPGAVSQAEDRCHRIGQKDSVNVHFLLAQNTIEEKIASLIDSKRKVLDSVLDGKESDQSALLWELMNQYK